MPLEIEPSCAAFLAHWKSRRGEKLVPTVAEFLDRPSTRHAPLTFMAEVTGEQLLIRLEGTGLVARWGRDLTGQLLFEQKSPEFRRKIAENFSTAIAQPCGYYALNEYISGRERHIVVRVLYLPLTGEKGRPHRVVGYSMESGKRMEGEPLLNTRRTIEAEWIDIGAGIPDKPPALASD